MNKIRPNKKPFTKANKQPLIKISEKTKDKLANFLIYFMIVFEFLWVAMVVFIFIVGLAMVFYWCFHFNTVKEYVIDAIKTMIGVM